MKYKITIGVFLGIIFGFLFISILSKDLTISLSERRTLTTFPKITWEDILNKKVMNGIDNYALDHFAYRDKFRNLKALMELNVFHKLDNNNIYIKDNYIFKSSYPTNYESINNFIRKINSIKTNYLKENKVYYSIIPDKNYYLKNDNHLNIDYEDLIKKVNQGLEDMEYIDITATLSLEDFYKTDTHWKQQNIRKVVDKLSQQMFFPTGHLTYDEKTFNPFYGVYYGQAAFNLKADELVYLTNEVISNAVVDNYTGNNKVYDESKLGSMDSYGIFLSGATPLITITNPSNKDAKELIIFRDSFGSSIAPLLIESYSKITLIDLRYITPQLMASEIEFTNQDVLFLYSTLLINDSKSIKE